MFSVANSSSSRLVPPHLRQYDDINPQHNNASGASTPSGLGKLRAMSMTADSSVGGGDMAGMDDLGVEPDPRAEAFRDSYRRSELAINRLFRVSDGSDGNDEETDIPGSPQQGLTNGVDSTSGAAVLEAREPTPKKSTRKAIDEDYGDDDDSEEEEPVTKASPAKAKTPVPAPSPSKPPSLTSKPSDVGKASIDNGKTAEKSSEEARKKLEEDKKTAEDAAKKSFHTMFYTFENDRDAMLEQQQLEEIDRQVEAEMSGANNAAGNMSSGQGKLSNVNLGASSLTLKHLIARVDEQRSNVHLTDLELKNLLSEVKKNRSKWANEEKVGQEELYEAAEKVLSELKAMTEHSTAFLTRVNKREAPDYYHIIKYPMDLGTMTKKLKSISYKSKKEFVDDLLAIWSNCLRYNADPSHYIRKHALSMRKETEKLIPLIPDIVIRDRAEVEAEERRRLAEEVGEPEGGDESDEEPVLSGRGRKAPGKSSKKGASKTKAPASEALEGTPVVESAPSIIIKTDLGRSDSHPPFEGSQTGFATPPPGANGSLTPMINGIGGSQDLDADNYGSSLKGFLERESEEHEDLEYKTWKMVTKKDRAKAAAERHRLFDGYKIAENEPALLRSKAGMRLWLRRQQESIPDEESAGASNGENKDGSGTKADRADKGEPNETLAEGMDQEPEKMLPDYYDISSAIPELPNRLNWAEDSEGNIVNSFYPSLHLSSKGQFLPPRGHLSEAVESNLAYFQSTRKICSKIQLIQLMKTQSQVFTSQIARYNPVPFLEEDVSPHVVSDDGPIMADVVIRSAFQRSVAKIFYHAGFEQFQPQAMEAITDLGAEYFRNLTKTLKLYHETPQIKDEEGKLSERYSPEEIVLLSLQENGVDLEGLETYVHDDVERHGVKLSAMNDRMRMHMADLLRPVVQGGEDGAQAFEDDSEQFVGGDFAEDLGEDYFGFRELGLDKELGLSISVPLHLLQSRLSNVYQSSQPNQVMETTFEPLPAFPALTLQMAKSQLGIVQSFFLAKIHANGDQPLTEDEDLPVKQRPPKPRLGPTGKITSPRKRPLREPGAGGSAKKKKKLNPANGTSESKTPTTDGPNGVRASSPLAMSRKDSSTVLEPASEVQERENNRAKVRILAPGADDDDDEDDEDDDDVRPPSKPGKNGTSLPSPESLAA
jgi:transcriptional activator SPT7